MAAMQNSLLISVNVVAVGEKDKISQSHSKVIRLLVGKSQHPTNIRQNRENHDGPALVLHKRNAN